MHKEKRGKKLSGLNPCGQMSCTKKRRMYSYMLIGHTYQPSAFMVVILGKHAEID